MEIGDYVDLSRQSVKEVVDKLHEFDIACEIVKQQKLFHVSNDSIFFSIGKTISCEIGVFSCKYLFLELRKKNKQIMYIKFKHLIIERPQDDIVFQIFPNSGMSYTMLNYTKLEEVL